MVAGIYWVSQIEDGLESPVLRPQGHSESREIWDWGGGGWEMGFVWVKSGGNAYKCVGAEPSAKSKLATEWGLISGFRIRFSAQVSNTLFVYPNT